MPVTSNTISPHFVIRPAHESDLPSIIKLDQNANPYPWSDKLVIDAVTTRNNWIVIMNRDDSRDIVGWLTASQVLDQSELEQILVCTSVRRQGVAKKLITTWLAYSADKGVTECLLEVRESNIGAIRLYESLGFEQVGLRKNYYKTDQGREAACLFTLII